MNCGPDIGIAWWLGRNLWRSERGENLTALRLGGAPGVLARAEDDFDPTVQCLLQILGLLCVQAVGAQPQAHVLSFELDEEQAPVQVGKGGREMVSLPGGDHLGWPAFVDYDADTRVVAVPCGADEGAGSETLPNIFTG